MFGPGVSPCLVLYWNLRDAWNWIFEKPEQPSIPWHAQGQTACSKEQLCRRDSSVFALHCTEKHPLSKIDAENVVLIAEFLQHESLRSAFSADVTREEESAKQSRIYRITMPDQLLYEFEFRSYNEIRFSIVHQDKGKQLLWLFTSPDPARSDVRIWYGYVHTAAESVGARPPQFTLVLDSSDRILADSSDRTRFLVLQLLRGHVDLKNVRKPKPGRWADWAWTQRERNNTRPAQEGTYEEVAIKVAYLMEMPWKLQLWFNDLISSKYHEIALYSDQCCSAGCTKTVWHRLSTLWHETLQYYPGEWWWNSISDERDLEPQHFTLTLLTGNDVFFQAFAGVFFHDMRLFSAKDCLRSRVDDVVSALTRLGGNLSEAGTHCGNGPNTDLADHGLWS